MKKLTILTLAILISITLASCNAPSDTVTDTSEIAIETTAKTTSEATVEIATETTAFENSEGEREQRLKYGGRYCYVHGNTPDDPYHSFVRPLTEYIGEETFREWMDTRDHYSALVPYEECPYKEGGIYQCVHYFGIPKDKMIEWLNDRSHNYNVDLLYGATYEQNDMYYRYLAKKNQEAYEERTNFEHCFKIPMASKLEGANFIRDSLIEMFYLSEMPLDEFKELRKAERREGEKEYDYDFALLESMSREELKELIDSHSAYYLDLLFCGLTPYETPYEHQRAENEIYCKENGIVLDPSNAKALELDVDIWKATDEELAKDDYYYHRYTTDENGVELIIRPTVTVIPFKLVRVEVTDTDGKIKYTVAEVLYELDDLGPNKPFMLKTLPAGLLPTYGITFSRGGIDYLYTINTTGLAPNEGEQYYLDRIE